MEAGVEVRSVGHTEADLLPLSGLQPRPRVVYQAATK